MINQRGDTNKGNQYRPASGQGGKRAQNKDNLDHRDNLEQDDKGDDVTHNEKQMRSDRKKVKNDNDRQSQSED